MKGRKRGNEGSRLPGGGGAVVLTPPCYFPLPLIKTYHLQSRRQNWWIYCRGLSGAAECPE